MAMKIAEAFVEIQGDKGKFSATIRQAKRETISFRKVAVRNLKRVGLTMAGIAAAATAVAIAIGVKLTRAIIRAGRSVISAAVKYDKLNRGFIAVTGSAAEAERQINRLRILALAPGLGFEQAIQGSIALQSAGIEAALAERALSAFGNALAIIGKGANELTRVNLQLSQIAAKTSGFGRDLLVIREAVPAIGPILSKAFEDQPLENMTITGKELITVLVEGLEGLGKAGETAANNIVNLGVSFDLLKKSIGDKFLEATKTATGGLTEIIDKLTLVIENYEDYRDEAAQVFRDLATIAIKLTGEMGIGMIRVIGKIAKVVWVPLKWEIIKTFQDIKDAVEIGMIEVTGKISRRAQDITDLMINTVKTARVTWDLNFKKIRDVEFESAIRTQLVGIEDDLGTMFDQLMAGFSDANVVLDKFTKKLPEAVAEPAKKAAEAFLKFGDIGFLDLFNKKARDDAVKFWKDQELAVERLAESIKRDADFRKGIDEEMKKRQGINLANFQEMLREQERAAQDFADAIRPAFEGMFIDFFSGNTKNLWQNFWSDLKRIAIREMASIFATQLLAGLLTGGTSLAATGIGASLSALAPKSIDPTSRAIGGGIARGARAIGNFLEGGTIVVNDQDLSNFDVQRMTKQVEQGIGPALRQAAADGIQ